jgi:hypothetical protein
MRSFAVEALTETAFQDSEEPLDALVNSLTSCPSIRTVRPHIGQRTEVWPLFCVSALSSTPQSHFQTVTLLIKTPFSVSSTSKFADPASGARNNETL